MKIYLFNFMIIGCFSFKSAIRSWVTNDYLKKHKNYDEWWDNPIIHTLGNSGIGGMMHAELAEFGTRTIDKKAYNGVDVRSELTNKYLYKVPHADNVIGVDFGCGVGLSTNSLYNSLNDRFKKVNVYGLDTSKQMINKARSINTNKKITFFNENVAKQPLVDFKNKVDIITIMYLLHEVPDPAQYDIINNAYKLLKSDGVLLIVDISENYNPSIPMLLGEPYILDYQENIRTTLNHFIMCEKFTTPETHFLNEYMPGHVTVSLLRKC